MKIFIYTALLIVLSISCKKEKYQPFDGYKIIADSELYGAGEEDIQSGNKVIKNKSDWEKLKDKMDSVNEESDQFENTPVDFDNEIVVACFDEVRGNSGYDISIQDIKETNDELIVDVEQTQVNSDSALTMTVIQQPYFIIKLNRTGKEIKFE